MSITHVKGLDYTPEEYPEDMNADVARRLHLARGELGDGGYDDEWVKAKLGYLPVVLPNTVGRKHALVAHDLHHVVTGCNTVWRQGEIDVSVFELRSGGCGRFWMGWFILLGLFGLGLLFRSRLTWRCFVQCRGARNLFATQDYAPVLAQSVGELRRRVGLSTQPLHPTRQDALAFGGWTLATVAMVAVLSAPLWFLLTVV